MASYKSILKKTKGKKVGLFIDDANLFYLQKILGWKVSWKKLKNFLSDYYELVVCNYYLGMPLTNVILMLRRKDKPAVAGG